MRDNTVFSPLPATAAAAESLLRLKDVRAPCNVRPHLVHPPALSQHSVSAHYQQSNSWKDLEE